MKKMSLKIATEALSREEMRNITGGSGGGGCRYMSCHCTDGGKGSWTGYYCGDAWVDAVLQYCGTSGACS